MAISSPARSGRSARWIIACTARNCLRFAKIRSIPSTTCVRVAGPALRRRLLPASRTTPRCGSRRAFTHEPWRDANQKRQASRTSRPARRLIATCAGRAVTEARDQARRRCVRARSRSTRGAATAFAAAPAPGTVARRLQRVAWPRRGVVAHLPRPRELVLERRVHRGELASRLRPGDRCRLSAVAISRN